MKLEVEVPVDLGTSDFTFESTPVLEVDLEDFLSSFLCFTRFFSFSNLLIALLIAGNASQYLNLSYITLVECFR